MSVPAPLKGARIWIAGAKPDGLDDAAAARFDAFVARLSALILQRGGSIVHGSHPTVRCTLLNAATEFQEGAEGPRDCLMLAASTFFYEEYKAHLPRWQKNSIVHEEPAYEKGDLQQRKAGSVELLRHWMVDRSDAVIAIGGRKWKENPRAAGVPAEFEFARRRGLPCFLLAGVSGAAAGYLQAKPESLKDLRNGLSQSENHALAQEQDIEALANRVVEQLSLLSLVRGEPLGRSTFRILALDGGGIKGTFTAAALSRWEEETGRPLTESFDLIAGTSTGGILALGLGMGLPAAAILKFYEERSRTVFPMVTLRDPQTGLGDIAWNLLRRLWEP